jgi:hypothetical protein
MKASCHCGAVRFEIAEAPACVAECNCSICAKLGTLWAYYPPDQVTSLGPPDQTLAYVRGDGRLEFHTCRTCGCTTHWQAIDARHATKMGVNARLMDGLTPEDVQIEHLDDSGLGHFWTQ